MTVVSKAAVIDIAPEFSSISPSVFQFYLDLAGDHIKESKWTTKYTRAVTLLTAHFLTMQARGAGGASGPITSESVGELSISYGTFQADDNEELKTTSYGLMYLSLRKTLKITPLVV